MSWQPRTTLWGTPLPTPPQEQDCPLRYPGQYADPETGLHYNYFRHYDPETARYLTPDPLGLAPAPNHFGYVQNPLTWEDPLGLRRCEEDSPEVPDDGAALTINEKQFGKKWGKHAQDYELDPGQATSRQWFRNRMSEIHDAPDEVRQGPWNPQGGGGPDYLFHRKGDDLLITKPSGEFVTMFPQKTPNGWFQGATRK